MSSMSQSRPYAGLVFTGSIAVALVALAIGLVGSDNLMDQLGPSYTAACFLALGAALWNVEIKMRSQFLRLRPRRRTTRRLTDTSSRWRFARLALTGLVTLGLVGFALYLWGDDDLRARLGEPYTIACFLVLVVAFRIVERKLRSQFRAWRD